MYFLLGFPIAVLLIPFNLLTGPLLMLAYILFSYIATKKLPKITIPHKINGIYFTASILSALPIGCTFSIRILNAFPQQKYGELTLIVLAIANLFVLLSIFSLYVFISFFASKKTTNKIKELEINTSKIKWSHISIIAIFSLITITLISANSPLYPINDNFDVNAYMTMGRGILKGYIPYKDLYDHKGPILFLLYTIAAAISSNSYLGVYVLEIISTFIFLFLYFKTLRIYIGDNAIYTIPFVIFSIYSVEAIRQGGSLEEFCLPILMYGVYTSIGCAENKKLPDVKTGLIIGITSGCIFWAKFTICGFYLGWIIVPTILAIKNKELNKYFKLLGSIILGVIIPSAISLIYCAANGAIKEMFRIYFFDNIFLYGNSKFSVFAFYYIYRYDLFIFALLAIGFCFYSFIGNKFANINLCCMYLASFFFTFCGGKIFKYYPLAFSIFAYPGICACFSIAQYILKKKPNKIFIKNKHILLKGISLFFTVALFTLMFLLSPNTRLMFVTREYFPQYRFADVISNSGIKNPTVVTYAGLDGGFYLASNVMPATKYYYQPNFNNKIIYEEQDRLITNGLVDFVIAEIKPESELTANFNHYILIDEYKYRSEDGYRVYQLYQKK